ncbi:MAG: phosphonate metabolism protein/1,5-bisphosphokinase (PRPP-forming) PhnN [Alcaligenaceae bacterium]|nr:MAG: phosphonate metabolism protein/1,5-bisphosphokinase (PRPP-forming) PhnN [Alcaligenaceae bacterium]
MASGSFFFVVGPSGAGKDSLIDGARQQLDPAQFMFAKRAITRPADSGGEAHQACTEAEFILLEQQGKFLITWQAHHLSYGLPSTLLDALSVGQHVIANGSRAMVAQLSARVPNLVVVEIGAPPEILAQRLSKRGRESATDVAKRLARRTEHYPEGTHVLRVTNDQTPAIGISRFLAALYTQLGQVPARLALLYKKIAGFSLTEAEYRPLLAAIHQRKYSGAELEAFLIACTQHLSDDELIAVARCRSELMSRISWGRDMVVDKHSLGGIPGSRVTMIVIPIVAAHGLMIPKTSSRAITSAAGTADAMEILAKVDLTPEQLKQCVAQTNACIAWNGKLNHSVIDDVMNALTRPLALDTRRWSVASILSKKYSAGATHVVIDIPYSSVGKVKTQPAAEELARLFEMVGAALGLVVKAFATDGQAPIGRGIGPALEARDVLQVLERDPLAPIDLLEKSLFFASQILALDPAVGSATKGHARALELLNSGAASDTMQKIIAAQGAQPSLTWAGVLKHEVRAQHSGRVQSIDGFVISGLGRCAGAPADQRAGVDLACGLGAEVNVGDLLYVLQASAPAKLAQAAALAQSDCGYRFI